MARLGAHRVVRARDRGDLPRGLRGGGLARLLRTAFAAAARARKAFVAADCSAAVRLPAAGEPGHRGGAHAPSQSVARGPARSWAIRIAASHGWSGSP